MTSGRALGAALCMAGVAGCLSERGVSEPVAAIDCRIPVEAVARGDRIVLIRGQRFLPDTVRARRGESVTWVNCESTEADPHTSTSVGGRWDSPLLRAGDSYSVAFTEGGTHGYTCTPHPHMRGVVIID